MVLTETSGGRKKLLVFMDRDGEPADFLETHPLLLGLVMLGVMLVFVALAWCTSKGFISWGWCADCKNAAVRQVRSRTKGSEMGAPLLGGEDGDTRISVEPEPEPEPSLGSE